MSELPFDCFSCSFPPRTVKVAVNRFICGQVIVRLRKDSLTLLEMGYKSEICQVSDENKGDEKVAYDAQILILYKVSYFLFVKF